MLDDLKNFASLMGQTKDLREKMAELQNQLGRISTEADAGGGAVRVVVNGKLEVVAVRFSPPLLSALAADDEDLDREMVEDLTTAAVNAAMNKAKQMVQEEVTRLTGGLNIPGLEKMLGQ